MRFKIFLYKSSSLISCVLLFTSVFLYSSTRSSNLVRTFHHPRTILNQPMFIRLKQIWSNYNKQFLILGLLSISYVILSSANGNVYVSDEHFDIVASKFKISVLLSIIQVFGILINFKYSQHFGYDFGFKFWYIFQRKYNHRWRIKINSIIARY